MSQGTRICLDCPADISHRHWRAVRCVECARARELTQLKHKQRTYYDHSCEWCNKSFRTRVKHQRFCGVKCCGLASHPGNVTNKCIVCSTEFTISRQFARDTCSRPCTAWHRKHPGELRPVKVSNTKSAARYVIELPNTECAACGGPLNRKHRDSVYCSSRCSKAQRRRITGKVNSPLVVADKCLTCGVDISHGRRLDAQYCSRACQAREQQERRSRKKSTAPVEIIHPGDIFRRDEWVCHLCHKQIDPLLRNQNPLMASVDHIIPVNHFRYPGHVWENLATAHLQCNISKSDKVTLDDWALYYQLKLERYGHLDELNRELIMLP